LIKFIPSLGALAFLSPFHAYRTEEILVHGSPDAAILYLIVYAAIPSIAAVISFSGRDTVL
jgi:hypothetical protein